MRTEDEDQLGHLTRGLDAFQDLEPFGADSVNWGRLGRLVITLAASSGATNNAQGWALPWRWRGDRSSRLL